MKFYVETASGLVLNLVEGFPLKDESYKYRASPTDPKEYDREAFTTEINSLEELLRFVNMFGGVVVEWQANYPPALPMQHIPTLRVVDAPL